MRVKEIALHRTLKLSRNYNSIGTDVAITAEIKDEEDINTAYQNLSQIIEDLMKRELEKQIELLENLS